MRNGSDAGRWLSARATFCSAGVAAVLLQGPAVAADWPQWRGPNRDGISLETGWLVNWPPAELWRKSVGEGFSAVSVSEGRVYTLGYASNRDTVYCFDAVNGTQVWSRSYASSTSGANGYNGPRATPVIDGDRVYTYNQQGSFNCLDKRTGAVLWTRRINTGPPDWGFTGSPLVEGDLIILNAGARGVAIDRFGTNAVVWTTSGSKAGYASPFVFTWNSRRLVAQFTGTQFVGIDPLNGQAVCWFPWSTSYGVNAPDPILYGNKVFVSTGYTTGCALAPLADGAMTAQWQNRNLCVKTGNHVVLGDYVYGVDEGGGVKCLDLRDGSVKWSSANTFGEGSLMASDGRLIVMAMGGGLEILRASPAAYDAEGRARYTVASGEWRATPVLANGKIYCRSRSGTLVCLDVRGPPRPPSVSNGAGVSGVTMTSAVFSGQVVAAGAAHPEVRIYWGPTDGGSVSSLWQNVASLGVRPPGEFSHPVGDLSPENCYFYRCYAVNADGGAWAATSVSFCTPALLRAVATAAPTNGIAPLTVLFDGRAAGGVTDVYSYAWDFGDGHRADRRIATNAYTFPGVYTAVFSACDGVSTATAAVVIHAEVLAPSARWFVTSNVLEDVVGGYALTQNSAVNPVRAVRSGTCWLAHFDGSGSHRGSDNQEAPPNGNFPYLYRSGAILGTSDGTIAFWVVRTGISPVYPGAGLYWERGIGDGLWQLDWYATNDLLRAHYGVGDQNEAPLPNSRIDVWCHLAMTKSNGTVRVYRNGVPVASGPAGSPGSASATLFGCIRDGGQFLIGYMHDFKLWRGAVLSDAQIREDFAAKSATLGGLVAYYPFDGDVTDATGRGHDGTIRGGAGYAPGHEGLALQVDGIDGRVDIGMDLMRTNEGTVMAWIRLADLSGAQTILGAASVQSGYFMASVQEGGRLTHFFHQQGKATWKHQSLAPLQTSRWYHVAFRHDATSTAMYVDGLPIAQDGSAADDPLYLHSFSTGIVYAVGALVYDTVASHFRGLIDEVRIYNRALSDPEIAQLAAGRPSSPTIDNALGATNVTASSAVLAGSLTSTGGAPTTVRIYWGPADGGTNPASWTGSTHLEGLGIGSFFATVSNLTPSTFYFYRCCASNAAGVAWAPETVSFTTPDAYEPNDTLGAAYDLSSRQRTWLRTVAGRGSQWDDDWYRIAVEAGSEHVAATCLFAHAEGDIDLRLYDGAGALLATSQSQTDREVIDLRAPVAGTYYLQVYGGNRGNTYDLWWDDVPVAASPGWLRIHLAPPAVVAAGAAWQLAGGGTNRYADGALVGLATGRYGVVCRDVDGWVRPGVETAEVLSRQTTTVTRTYTLQPPQAGLSGNPRSGVAPLEVVFTDESAGVVTNRQWDFDNDGVWDAAGPAGTVDHTYSNAGTYSVRLTVRGPGGTGTLLRTDYIQVVPPPPNADFSATPLTGVGTLAVTFTDRSSGNITNRVWDFQDDGVADARNPVGSVQFTYTNVGAFSVRLTVSGPGGTDAELKASFITVTPAPPANRAPVVCVVTQQIFLSSLADMALPDASCSSDADGDPLFFSWREDYRNPVHGLIPIGGEGLARLPVYFPAPGRYVFEVRVSDGVDMSADTRIVTVYVPGLMGAVKYDLTSGLICVPDVQIEAFASAEDAVAGRTPAARAVSDSVGRFVLDTLAPLSTTQGRQYYVRESRPGFRTSQLRTMTVWPDPSGKPENTYDWKIMRGTVEFLTGWVFSTNNLPIEGAHVAMVMGVGSEIKSDQTGTEGSFGLSYVPYGSWSIQLRAPGYQSEVRDVNVGPDMGELTFHLTPAAGGGTGTLEGRATVAGVGSAAAGVRVTLGAGTGTETVSGSDGLFRFTGLPLGRYILTATRDGYETVRVPLVTVQTGTQRVDLRLYPAQSPVLQGTVLDRLSGRGVRLATVGIESVAGLLVRSDVSDLTGYFQIFDAPLGSNQVLRINAPGYHPRVLRVNVGGSARVDPVALDRAANWRMPGSRDPAGPVARLSERFVYLPDLTASAWLDATGSTGTNLTYLWREAPQNPVSMLPAGAGNMNRIQLSGFSRPGVYHFELQVRDASRLSANRAMMTVCAPGLAGDVHASPSDGVVSLGSTTVRVYTNYAHAAAMDPVSFVGSTDTDSQGRFILGTVRTGDYWVVAYDDAGAYRAYGPVRRRVNYSAAAGRMAVNMARQEFTLDGYIIDADDKRPLENVRIVVAPGLRSEVYRTTTDANGHFRLASVLGGSQYLLVMKDGYQAKAQTRDIARNQQLNLTLTRNVAGQLAALRGKVTADYQGIRLPVANAEVVIGSGLAQAYTDAVGEYEIRDLPPGIYFGLIRKDGYRARYLDDGGITTLAAGENVRDRVLEFSDQGPAIRGIVVGENGQALEGVAVTVLAPAPVTALALRTAPGASGSMRVHASAVASDGAGVFQLTGLPDGERMLQATLPHGTVYRQSIHVAGTMESALVVPDVVLAYDAWQARHFPPGGGPRAALDADPDGDRASNWEEFLADTSPTNRESVFAARMLGTGAHTWQMTIDGVSTTRIYEVHWSTNLLDRAWHTNVLGPGGFFNPLLTVTNQAGWPQCFYRIGARP